MYETYFKLLPEELLLVISLYVYEIWDLTVFYRGIGITSVKDQDELHRKLTLLKYPSEYRNIQTVINDYPFDWRHMFQDLRGKRSIEYNTYLVLKKYPLIYKLVTDYIKLNLKKEMKYGLTSSRFLADLDKNMHKPLLNDTFVKNRPDRIIEKFKLDLYRLPGELIYEIYKIYYEKYHKNDI